MSREGDYYMGGVVKSRKSHVRNHIKIYLSNDEFFRMINIPFSFIFETRKFTDSSFYSICTYFHNDLLRLKFHHTWMYSTPPILNNQSLKYALFCDKITLIVH